MFGKSPFLPLISITLLVWSLCFYLSQYQASSLIRQQKSTAHQKPSPELEILEKRALENPEQIPLLLELGEKYQKEAAQLSNPAYIMKAVDTYQTILKTDPENDTALLSLASLASQFGVFERAEEYYKRYLKKHPDDYASKNDFALSLLQNGNLPQAKLLFQEILSKQPQFVPSLLGLALCVRQDGDNAQAQTLAKQALLAAQTEEEKKKVETILILFRQPPTTTQGNPQIIQDEISPAQSVQNFFSSHPIIGPKLQKIQWESSSVAVVYVKDFPMKDMPEFARTKFIDRIQTSFQNFSEPVTIIIREDQSSAELLKVTVGSTSSQ